MKINELKINSYGKLRDKDIIFKDGINIVYGENERGKSTLLNSIVNLLYGTSKNKKGKKFSDYDRFKPWEGEEFSGKITYSLNSGEKYEVFRDFGKKNPKIYDRNMEDISKEFSIDKSTGSQFFLEQTNVDESTFISTVVSFQGSIELDNQTQNILLQKIANTSSTGDDGISYKKAIDKLNKKQLDEIGTNRSQGKPINIVANEIQKLTELNENLRQYEDYKYEIEDKKYKIQDEIHIIQSKSDFFTKLNNINQEQNIENEKLKYSESKIDELEEKIQVLIDEKEVIKEDFKNIKSFKTEKVMESPYIVAIILSFVIAISLFAVTKKNISFLALMVGVISFVLLILKKNKAKINNKRNAYEIEQIKKYNNNIEKKLYEIDAQIAILEKSKEDQVNDAENIKNQTIKNLNERRNNLKVNYMNEMDLASITHYMNSNMLQYEIDQNNRLMNDKNMELHKLQLDKESILPKLEELAENEEQIVSYQEHYNELIKKNNAIDMAKEIIENAYQKMKSNVTPKFTDNLSKNIAIITNNKYRKIIISEDNGILVELENGEYKSADLLSKGTIEQLYLAFRLSIIEDISTESMPIIFDETFAYFDDYRLKETLLNLKNNYGKKHQIILFTCTKREEEALRSLNIDYNLINL